MKDKKNKKEFQLPESLDSIRDKYDPELDKRKNVGESSKSLELANKILEETPVPQWILDL